MKFTGITIIVLLLLAVFACNSNRSKKVEDKSPTARKASSGKSIVEKTVGIEPNELNPLEYTVKEILTTSPRYKQLTKGLYEAIQKNGGQNFGISLEASPYPRQNKPWGYSKTYDFTLYEMYPDRQLNTTRFSFNPDNKLLYEYDAIFDQLVSIEFDRKLLLKYEALNEVQK